jgi:hypothetical protein
MIVASKAQQRDDDLGRHTPLCRPLDVVPTSENATMKNLTSKRIKAEETVNPMNGFTTEVTGTSPDQRMEERDKRESAYSSHSADVLTPPSKR